MTDGEVIRFIRMEITKQLNVILSGKTASATEQSEDIEEMFPGMPTVTQRPVMHPYGFVSKAKTGTLSVVARQGEHIGNRMVLGHRDKDRPTDLEEGETAIYSLGKYTVRSRNGKLELGKDGDYEEMVMGETLRQFLILLIQHIMLHTHQSNVPSAPTSVPLNNIDFQQIQAENLDNEKILSKDGGRF